MLYICKDCPGHPDFLSQYNKENHRGQCHANITRCKDATGNPHELHRQPTGLFYCPTCGIGCDVANAIRPHVSKCREPKGSGEGRNVERMGGFSHPLDTRMSKVTGTKNSSASPSPGPSPSSNANASSSRPAKATAPKSSLALSFATGDDSDDEEEEKERTRKETGRAAKEKDRLEVEKKREKAREEGRKKEREREQERERERKASRPQPVEQPSGPRLPALPSFKKKPAELPSSAGRTVPAGGSTSNGGSGTTFARAPNANELHHPHSAFASGSNSSYPLPPPPFQPKPSNNLLPGFPNPPRPAAPLPNRTSRLPSVDPLDSFNDHPPVAAAPQAPLSVITRPVEVDNPPSTTHSTYPSGLPLSNPNRRLPAPAKSSLKRPPPPPPPIVEPSVPRPSPVVVPSHLQAQPHPPPIASVASSSLQAQPNSKKGKAAAAGGPVHPPFHNAFEVAERMFHMSGLKSQVGNFTLGKTPEEGKKLRKAVQKLLRSLKPKKVKEPVLKPVSSVGVPLKSFAPPPPNSLSRPLLSKPDVALPAPPLNASPLPLPLPVASTSTSAIVRPAPLPAAASSVPAQAHPPFVAAPAVEKAPVVPTVLPAPAPISTVDLASSSSSVKRPREEVAEEDAPMAKKPMMMMKKTGVEVDW